VFSQSMIEAPPNRVSVDIKLEEIIMTALKSALGAAALVLCFGAGSALAQNTPGNNTTTTTTGATPVGPQTGGNTNTANPSASVVQECEAKAEQQGLSGDAKGAFLTDCENTPMKKQ